MNRNQEQKRHDKMAEKRYRDMICGVPWDMRDYKSPRDLRPVSWRKIFDDSAIRGVWQSVNESLPYVQAGFRRRVYAMLENGEQWRCLYSAGKFDLPKKPAYWMYGLSRITQKYRGM